MIWAAVVRSALCWRSHTFLGNEAFTPGWKPHHHHTHLEVLHLDTIGATCHGIRFRSASLSRWQQVEGLAVERENKEKTKQVIKAPFAREEKD